MHQELRKHDWMRTFTGKKFYPFEPSPDAICIEDIAHALSMQCRYTGHVSRFYSVAEHCLLLTGVVASRLKDMVRFGPQNKNLLKWALLHDAAEAYVGDMGRPLKHQPEMELYRQTEAGVMLAIRNKFGLVGEEPSMVALLDKEIIGSEARMLKYGESLATVDPLPEMLPELRGGSIGVSPERAESEFLHMFATIDASTDYNLDLGPARA